MQGQGAQAGIAGHGGAADRIDLVKCSKNVLSPAGAGAPRFIEPAAHTSLGPVPATAFGVSAGLPGVHDAIEATGPEPPAIGARRPCYSSFL